MRYFLLSALFILFFNTCLAGTDNEIFGKPFSDGSPSCTTCHSIVAAGYNSSTYGPDISTLVEDMGDDAISLIEFVKASGIVPMDTTYGNSKITEKEMGELILAFSKLKTENVENSDKYSVVMYAFFMFVILLLIGRVFFKHNSSLEENL